jgi:hypothetical protein
VIAVSGPNTGGPAVVDSDAEPHPRARTDTAAK